VAPLCAAEFAYKNDTVSCFNPISATLGKTRSNGRNEIIFTGARDQRSENSIKLPCGKCIGCLRNRAREWSIRCVHEASEHAQNCFLTLTYDKNHLPKNGSLDVSDIQKFFKRLRKRAGKVRYFQCGEYGAKLQRPHHHVILFGYNFPDQVFWKSNGLKQKIYTSKLLSEIWPHGFSTIGQVTNESVNYVARYTLKKVYGQQAKEHYGNRKPEFVTMSRKPGIGKSWYDKYKSDIYPKGVLFHQGHAQMPPRYYDKIFGQAHPQELEDIKEDRKQRSSKVRTYDYINGKTRRVSNSDTFSNSTRENIVLWRMEKLKRFMED